jgi:hypothetical protein
MPGPDEGPAGAVAAAGGVLCGVILCERDANYLTFRARTVKRQLADRRRDRADG